jgi:hypothetical protein
VIISTLCNAAFFDTHLFEINPMFEYMNIPDLVRFSSINKYMRSHILHSPDGEVQRRMMRFNEIKHEIRRLLQPYAPSLESAHMAICLYQEASSLIDSGLRLLDHSVGVAQQIGVTQKEGDCCPLCSRDTFFREERVQLKSHNYYEMTDQCLMLPVEFYCLETNTNFYWPAPLKGNILWWKERLQLLLPKSQNICVAWVSYTPCVLTCSRPLSRAVTVSTRALNQVIGCIWSDFPAFRCAARQCVLQEPEYIPVVRFLLYEISALLDEAYTGEGGLLRNAS